MGIKLVPFIVLGLLSIQSISVAQQTKGPFQTVGQEDLECAMEAVLEKETGSGLAYDPTATPNGVRYQLDVIVYLLENKVRQDHKSPEETLPLLVGYKEWYQAFKNVNCQDQDVPEYVDRAYEYKQNLVIDYNRNNVVKETYDTDTPYLAANITLFWDSPEKSFSYKDLDSKPPLKIIYERVITYRFLKYKEDNLVVCDQIKGLKGKALKGFLRIFGKVHMMQYRTVAVKDGPQYVLVGVRKFRWLFGPNIDLTITPDGVTLDGVPDNEKQRLRRKIRIQYEPLKPG
ncbi:MAG: hypothetical protein MAG551_00868 [Candidatus Scalindua arabica]|uniref:Uncharacterized protein n=1 Tax=Candidatus Scalindua arabica TaxID=1127984 RepID=A0A941W4G7_9BACT|nr:hypothetical protein [Candidatus Scalindua arabica]